MIRQHFYPKSFFRHRSLSKSQNKTNFNFNQNNDSFSLKQIQCNQIKFIKKKLPHNSTNLQESIHLETFNTEDQQHQTPKITHSTKKIQNFPSEHSNAEIFQNNVLRQIHNRTNRQNYLQKQKVIDNDIKNLFIKSDRKEIVKTSKKKYRPHENQNNENQSFIIDNCWSNEKRKRSSRKLSTADPSRSYKRSIQRKKKVQKNPAEIIINSTISTVDARTITHCDKKKEPVFQRITDNMINLNLSKAIKFRQSGPYDRNFRQRKTSHKINLDCIEKKKNELEQKVRGWEIQVEDDIDFS